MDDGRIGHAELERGPHAGASCSPTSSPRSAPYGDSAQCVADQGTRFWLDHV